MTGTLEITSYEPCPGVTRWHWSVDVEHRWRPVAWLQCCRDYATQGGATCAGRRTAKRLGITIQ